MAILSQAHAGAEGKGGSFPYYESNVYKIIKSSQAALLEKLNKWDEESFSKVINQEFAHPISLKELKGIISHLQLKPAETGTAINPYGIEEPLAMHYGVDSKGQKYIVAYGRLFDFINYECKVEIKHNSIANEIEVGSCYKLELKLLHEALHHFGYEEDQAQANKYKMLELIDIGFNILEETTHIKSKSLLYKEASEQIIQWAFEGKTFNKVVTLQAIDSNSPDSTSSNKYWGITLDLRTPRNNLSELILDRKTYGSFYYDQSFFLTSRRQNYDIHAETMPSEFKLSYEDKDKIEYRSSVLSSESKGRVTFSENKLKLSANKYIHVSEEGKTFDNTPFESLESHLIISKLPLGREIHIDLMDRVVFRGAKIKMASSKPPTQLVMSIHIP